MLQTGSSDKIVRIKAFRAIHNHQLCEKFLEGHRRVLEIVGVKKVSSAMPEWMENPSAFVLLVESVDGEKTYGGARIHAADGKKPLPIEAAVGEFDPRIKELVKKNKHEGTGELCGLWNSREVAGMGIGSTYLTRAGVAISTQLGLKSLFALCAPYTVKMAENVGYRVEPGVGNNGTFYYPKVDLIATAVFLDDINTLETAADEDKDRVFALRETPKQTLLEKGRNTEFYIEYDLFIQDADPYEFKKAE